MAAPITPTSPPMFESAPPPGRRRPVREGLRMALAALAAGALVLGVLVLVTRGPTTDDAVANSSEDATPNGAATPIPDPSRSACPVGTRAEICDAVRFIEDVKQRPFKRFPVVNFLDNEAFDAWLLQGVDSDSPDLANTGDVFISLGLIDPDVDLAEVLTASLESGVVGAYDPDTEELNVLGTELDLYTELVMVHELTHAWDDQWFDISRPELDDVDDESASGFLQLVEGSASLVTNMWRRSLSESDRRELSGLEIGALSPDDLAVLLAIPSFVLEIQASPYVDGAAFVQSVFDAGGIEAVDRLFDAPPTTTEQVLHPEAYAAGEGPIDVGRPQPRQDDAEIISEGLLGELTFDLWFGDRAGDGWGGDRYVSWRAPSLDDGRTTCTAVNVVGDTPADTAELLDAAKAWAREREGRSAASIGGIVTMLGCS